MILWAFYPCYSAVKENVVGGSQMKAAGADVLPCSALKPDGAEIAFHNQHRDQSNHHTNTQANPHRIHRNDT